VKREFELAVTPETAFDENLLEQAIIRESGLPAEEVKLIHKLKRSIDARGRKVLVRFKVDVYASDPPPGLLTAAINYQEVSNKPVIIIVGAGPAGLFAALRCAELGYRPVVLERGLDVRSRRRDLAAINKEHKVNPESNYCFGEGGAGTYSDGKLYTRSKKRGDVQRILNLLVQFGATPEILYDAHPHIGTNKLPAIITRIREQIESAGGEVRFNAKVTGFLQEKAEVKGVQLADGTQLAAEAVILATGHSARDIYELLPRQNIRVEAKPFAMGVRAEHSQQFIDSIQYHCPDRGPLLPAAAYSLVHQTTYKGEQRGVFSFCMCPGGFIVPAATAPGEVVVNGMSPSRRDSRFANSGIVVAINLEDMDLKQHGEMAGLRMQEQLEQAACQLAGGTQTAPAQRLLDFVKGKASTSLLETSYQPGLASVLMKEVLGPNLHTRLVQGFEAFGKKMPGYLTNEAQIVGVESRTSSPVRIPRDPETLQHPDWKGLFPCGEGAGYAGGIVSAAMDGERCAEQAVAMIGKVS
jgi:uncharacterized FAD-dependent dehydrogenase